MAQLQNLSLVRMQLGVLCDQFIRSLQVDGSGNMLLPELEALSLSPCTTSVDGIVATMLESRLTFNGSLKEVGFSFYKTSEQDKNIFIMLFSFLAQSPPREAYTQCVPYMRMRMCSSRMR